MYVGEACNIHVESPLGVYVMLLTSYTDLIADVTSIVIDGVSVLQNRQYSSDLADPSTQAYQSLEQEFCNEVGFELFTIIPPFGKFRSWEFCYYLHEKCHAAYLTEVLVQESRFVAGHKQYCI